MRVTQIKCDRCGEVIRLGKQASVNVRPNDNNMTTALDICPKCYGQIFPWLQYEREGE